MSTITIRELLSSPALKADRGFNSLFAAYASTQRPSCGKCRKNRNMTTCKTLLGSLAGTRRQLLLDTFGLKENAVLTVYNMGTAFGLKVTY